MTLIRSRIKLAALIPSDAANRVNEKLWEKGFVIDVGNLQAEGLEQMIGALADMEVDLQDDTERVRVFVE